MKQSNWKTKWQYLIDNLMSKGTLALIGVLFGITMLVAVIAGVLTILIGTSANVGAGIWNSLMHILDAGTLTADTLDNIPNIIVMTAVTLCGLFVTSILIGIITTGFEQKIRDLSKGRSVVQETHHTVILGFNDNIYAILRELIEANSNHKNQCIVVAGEQEKEEMEEAIHAHITDFKTTRVVCRSGALHETYTLSLCALENSRSILINLEEDAQTIKIILAVNAYLKEHEPLVKDLYMTAAVQEKQNVDAARLAGEGRAEVIYASSAISRIIAHTCRQPGLSNVLVELFDFGGDELYFERIPQLNGETFRAALNRFSRAVAFGIRDEAGVHLNPPMDTVLKKGDMLILLEEDDGAYSLSGTPTVREDQICADSGTAHGENRDLLILGTSDMLERILEEYDHYAHGETVVTILCQKELSLAHDCYPNIRLQIVTGSETDRYLLEEQFSVSARDVLILSDPEEDAEASDAKALLQLLFLKDIAQRRQLQFTTTCEMRRSDNQRLAARAQVEDFVIGSNIVNLMMTQISENRDLAALFDDILDEDGSELYMKPASQYVSLGMPVDFYTVTESASRQGAVAIGYKLLRDGRMEQVTNPPKEETVVFEPGDAIIVIAED